MNLADIQKRVLASSLKKYLLDEYPNATAAYSLRKLRSGYTGNCIQVRRSSDNALQNIGFVNDVLDTTSLLSFVGAGNGFVRTWYDQSGNGRNGTQTSNSAQPQIVSSGNLLVTNNKVRIDFNGNNFLAFTSFNYNAQNFETFVGKRNASGRRLFALGRITMPSGYLWGLMSDNRYYYQGASAVGYQISSSTDLTTAQLILTGFRNTAGNMQMYKNGGLITSSFVSFNLQNGIDSIGNYGAGSQNAFCELHEIVFYNSDQSSNRTGIESNINAYYNIY